MEAKCSFETLVDSEHTAQRCILETEQFTAVRVSNLISLSVIQTLVLSLEKNISVSSMLDTRTCYCDMQPSLRIIHVEQHPVVHRICNKNDGSIAMDSARIVLDNFLACPRKVLASAQGSSSPLSTDSEDPKGKLDHTS
jgi:hypothetical protein